jgi:hypothetical protein
MITVCFNIHSQLIFENDITHLPDQPNETFYISITFLMTFININ